MGYICEPASRQNLRDYAYQIRKNLGMEDDMYFPVVEFLEILPRIFPYMSYEIVLDDELDIHIHAETDIENNIIRIKQSVYDGAFSGKGRDRFTIAHEIGHFLLMCVSGVKFARSITKPRPFEDPEWQADAFAGELLVPHHKLKRYKKPSTLARRCGVSIDCAELALKKK